MIMEIMNNMRQRVGSTMGNSYSTIMMVFDSKLSARMETGMEGLDNTKME